MRSLDELQRLAEQGHDESQFLLGYMYASGRGAAKDARLARQWLEKAARANNPRAQYYLGELYSEAGKAEPEAAYKHMAYWWGKSAAHPYWETVEGYDGRAISMRRLAWLHMHSGFDGADPEDALRLLETLTTKFSSPRSAIELGIVYAAGSFMPLSKHIGGTPIEQDGVKGIRLIERGVLIIENGSNDIDYNLYSAIGDTYLASEGPVSAAALHKGIIYKRKAYDRARGVNEEAAASLLSQLSKLESRPGHMPHAEPEQADVPPNKELDAKLEQFGEYFDGLELEDKRDFIKNLDQKLQENPDPAYDAFLRRCIAKYTALSQGVNTGSQAQAHFGGDSAGLVQEAYPDIRHDAYQQEGFRDARHDAYSYPSDGTQPAYDGTEAPTPPTQEGYAPGEHPLGNYTDRIHNYGSSSTFVIGSLLYTIGSLLLPLVLGFFVEHRFGFLGFGAILFTAPPFIALWLIVAASKNPKPPEKTLTALAFFRLTFFLHLGVIAAIAAGMAIRFGMDGQLIAGLSVFDNAMDLVMVLAGLAVVVLYVTFYYGSLFSILKVVRDNIYSNMFEPLAGIGAFSAIHNIVSGLVLIGSVGVIVLGLAPLDLDFVRIPRVVSQWFENAYLALALVAVTMIISRIGGLVCTGALRQFNNGLEAELEEFEEYSE